MNARDRIIRAIRCFQALGFVIEDGESVEESADHCIRDCGGDTDAALAEMTRLLKIAKGQAERGLRSPEGRKSFGRMRRDYKPD
jgi:hypothetical protein